MIDYKAIFFVNLINAIGHDLKDDEAIKVAIEWTQDDVANLCKNLLKDYLTSDEFKCKMKTIQDESSPSVEIWHEIKRGT